LKAFNINIVGLSKKANLFSIDFGDEFFDTFEAGLVSGSKFNASLVVDKHETFIETTFSIKGHVGLVCDRSLEAFDEPMTIDKKIVFKYGEEEMELSDEIIVINPDRAQLDLGQYVYEFIVLSIPMKRLHPKFRDADEDEEEVLTEGKLVYSSGPEETTDEEIDPRWEQLKKLK
jgi:uncharacterized protein